MSITQDQIFGTIRREPDGKWIVLNDEGHLSQGISHVEVYMNKCLKVWFTNPATYVGTFVPQTDETLARADIRLGASVGLDFAYIYMYQGESTAHLNPATITNPSANIWIYAVNWITPR